MTSRPRTLAALLLALGLAGCASETPPQLLDRLDRELASGIAFDPSTPATRPATALADVVVPDAAGPEIFVKLALERNPNLAAASAQVKKTSNKVIQSRALDDPMLMVTPIGEMAETAAGMVGTMLSLTQTFPLPQKLDARADAAERETAAAVAQRERLRQEIAAQTRRAFWTYWLADRQLVVMRQSRDLLADLQEAARFQLQAGRAEQADVLRATTELANLENELIDLRQAKDVAAAALNRLINRPPTAPLPEPPDVEPEVLDVDPEALLAEAAVVNPQLAARVAEIEAARARLRLANLDYWPDLGVTGSYTFVDDEGMAPMATGQDQWSIGFSINVPLWVGKRRAAVREARYAIVEQIARLAADRNDIAYAVHEAAADVEARQRMVVLLREQVLPQARQTVEVTAAAYRAGRTGFLDYIDAWRRLLDFELAERRAQSDLGRAVADLEEALGRGVDELTETEVLP